MSVIGRLFIEYGAKTDKLRRGVGEADKIMGRSRRDMEKMGRGLRDTGATLTKGLTLPIVGIGVAALKTSIDFESAFAGVRKTVDGTEAQMATLRQGIIDMANELPASREEIAGVAEAAGQLGIQTDSILGFSKVMVDLGETTNLQASEAATSLARLANITQMPQSEFDRLGSTVVELGNNLATTEAEIVDMGLRLAGAGKQVGMTEDQILGMAGALSSLGVRSQAGGTAFSRVMLEMQSEVKSGGELLEGFARVAGMSAEQFADAFEADAASAIVSFVGGLGRIQDSGGNVAGVLDLLGFGGIRVRDSLLRSAGAGDLLTRSLDLGAEAWKQNTALTKEAELRYGTTASKLSTLWNRVTNVARTLGDSLVPALMASIDAAEPLINLAQRAAEAFADAPEPVQIFVIALAGFTAAAGPAIAMIGMMAIAFATLNVSLGVLALVVVGLAALVTAAIFVAKNWDRIWPAIKRTVMDALGAVGRFVKRWWPLLLAPMTGGLSVLIGLFDEGFRKRIFGIVVSWGEAVIRFIRELPGKLFRLGVEIANGLVRGIAKGQPLAAAAGKGLAGAAFNAVKGFFGISSPARAMIPVGQDVARGVAVGIDKGTGDVLASIGRLGDEMRAAFDQAADATSGLDAAVARLRDQMAGAADRELREQIATVDGGLLPAYDRAVAKVGELEAKIVTLEGVLASERAEMDLLAAAVDSATGEFDRQQAILDDAASTLDAFKGQVGGLADEVSGLEGELKAAEQTLQGFLNAPLAGSGALDDEMFATGTAIAELQKALLELEQAHKAQTAPIEDAIAAMELQIAQAEAMGKSSDDIKPMRDELERLRDELEVVNKRFQIDTSPLRRDLERLRATAEELRLRERLELDPLERELRKAFESSVELTFAEAMQGARDAAAEIAGLRDRLGESEDRLLTQRARLDEMTAAVERQRDRVNEARGAMEASEQAYATQEELVRSLEGAIGDLEGQVDQMRAGIQESVDLVAEKFAELTEAAEAAADDFGGSLDDMMGDLADFELAFGETNKTAKELAADLGRAMLGVASSIADTFSSTFDWLTGLAGIDLSNPTSTPPPPPPPPPPPSGGSGGYFAHGGQARTSGWYGINENRAEAAYLPAGTIVDSQQGGGRRDGDVGDGDLVLVVDGREIGRIAKRELLKDGQRNVDIFGGVD